MKRKAKLGPEGLVLYVPEQYMTLRLDEQETKDFFKKQLGKDINLPDDYPGPEIVHLEIANRCNLGCPYCYHGKKEGKELSTSQWKLIIKKLARSGVFQITFGGGEPTLRKDLIELAAYTKSVGLNLTMTSNGILIPYFKTEELNYFDQINISVHEANRNPMEILARALDHLEVKGIRRGINFTLSKQYLPWLKQTAKIAKAYDAEILLLTYKPVIEDKENQIPPEEVYKYGLQMHKEMGLKVAVDGATCRTCLGSKRFMDIDSLGNVFPCSFIRQGQGNVLRDDIETIWRYRTKKLECPYVTGVDNGKR